MDVSRWALHRRMALPDWCFGQRWWIGGFIGTEAAGTTYFFFSDFPPDVFCLWDVLVAPGGITAAIRLDLKLCLCRETPVSGNIRVLTPLLRQFGTPGSFYDIHLPPGATTHLGPMKTLIEANNNGVGGALKYISETETLESSIALLVSALPREVPDWVVSGLAGVR